MKTTLKDFLSRYHIRYIRSLVYMLQASEYHAGDFLSWFWRTGDFSRVEQRKTLAKTPKTCTLLVLGYLLVILLYGFAVWILVVLTMWWKYPVCLLVALGTPFALAYGFVGLIVIGRLVQLPIEYVIILRAGKKLQAHKGLKIAIAGSFGKTSMREILKTVISEGKRVAAPPGSYNTPLGISSFVGKLNGDEEVLIFELGEYYPGDIKKLCKLVQPDMGIITGVNEAHLEKFGDIERTRKTIFELADYLGEKPLYINGENKVATSSIPPFLKEVPSSAKAEDLKSLPASEGSTPFTKGRISGQAVLYTRAGAGEWKVENAKTGLNGTTFALRGNLGTIQVRSGLLGLHQIGPLVVVAHIALSIGLTTEEVRRGIAKTKPFEHRLEPKTDAHGVTTLDDSYNGNPDGVRAVIEFLSSLHGVRRWYVTPGLVEMGPRKEEVHAEIGRQLARAGIEKVILIRNSVTPFIEWGLQKEKYVGEVIWFDRAFDAFSALQNLTVKGDVVLLQNDWPDQYA